jgi:hypothetical protein
MTEDQDLPFGQQYATRGKYCKHCNQLLTHSMYRDATTMLILYNPYAIGNTIHLWHNESAHDSPFQCIVYLGAELRRVSAVLESHNL